jgi:hypothetical protein
MSVLSLKSNSSLTARTIQVAEATTAAPVKVTRAADVERGFETVAAALTVITTATTDVENNAEATATTAFK